MEKKQSGEVTISLTFREETKTSLHLSLDTIMVELPQYF